jgi:hypothetical protein
MSKENVIRCDGCGKAKQTHESTGSPWLSVQAQTSPEEYQGVVMKLQGGASLESLIDTGDFCSLLCLADWASARHALRALSTEVTGEGTY